ncbi:hypothetical protein [Streptomyces sp. NPDC001020]
MFRNDPAQAAGPFRELLVEGRFEEYVEEVVSAVLDRTPGAPTRAACESVLA